MKRLIVLFIISLTISYSNNLFALEKLHGGPTTIEQAKSYFFKNRKLDIIEGIWFNEFSDSYRAIVKEGEGVYSQWQITYKGKANGEGAKKSIVRSASDRVYIYHTIVTSSKTRSEKEISGIIKLSGDLIEFSVKPFYFDDGTYSQGIPNRKEIRIWPNNIYDHNANVQIKVENFNPQENKAKRSEKLSSKLNDNSSSTDYKSYWWVLVLLAGVAFFIYTQTKKSFKKKEKIVKPKAIKKEDSFFKKFFEGKESLGFSYWVMFTAIPVINALIFYVLESSKSINKDSRDAIAGLFGWWMLAFFIYATIGTWRSAAAYKLEKESKKEGFGWAIAAYVTIVISIISFIGRVIKNLNS
jgi:hypothetical protein